MRLVFVLHMSLHDFTHVTSVVWAAFLLCTPLARPHAAHAHMSLSLCDTCLFTDYRAVHIYRKHRATEAHERSRLQGVKNMGVAATRARLTRLAHLLSVVSLSVVSQPQPLLSRAPSKHRKRSCSSAARRDPPPPRPRFTSRTAIATPATAPVVLALTGRGQKSSGSTALEAKSKGQA